LFAVALVTLAALTAGSNPAAAQNGKKTFPRQILIIRHAEKPPDSAMSVDLSPEGKRRADALPELFKPSDQRPTPFPTPDYIFATKNTMRSHRPLETVAPLAKKLNLPVNAAVENADFAKLAAEILTNQKYAGKTILICWHHGKISDLASALGATDVPDRWKDSVFDQVWVVTYDKQGKAQPLGQFPQGLLPQDKKK
jgi:hypothetical protein